MSSGLRERKKRATRKRIQAAALDLFARDGFRATTVAAIARAADVAPRTVFLHFPAKEDLLFAHDSAFDDLQARLEGRAEGETALDALRAWIAEGWWEHSDRDDEQRRRDWERARSRRAIIDADPVLRQRQLGELDRAERLIAAAVARDTGEDPDDLLPLMAAAATVSVLSMLGRTRSAGDARPLTAEQGLALVDRAVCFLRGGMAAVTEARRGPERSAGD